jgi:hypothetical protein
VAGRRCGEEPDAAVGEYAVYIENNEPDALSAFLGRKTYSCHISAL